MTDARQLPVSVLLTLTQVQGLALVTNLLNQTLQIVCDWENQPKD